LQLVNGFRGAPEKKILIKEGKGRFLTDRLLVFAKSGGLLTEASLAVPKQGGTPAIKDNNNKRREGKDGHWLHGAK